MFVKRLGLGGGACHESVSPYVGLEVDFVVPLPDLVVFEVFERNTVQPLEFFIEIFFQGEEDFGTVDPD